MGTVKLESVKELKKNEDWSPKSWRGFPISQMPLYQCEKKLDNVCEIIYNSPGLVNFSKILDLKSKLGDMGDNRSFIIQIGDCAENFSYSVSRYVNNALGLFNNISKIFKECNISPIIIGRIAGQFAKPRSSMQELCNGKILPSFHGDIINGESFEDRIPDPNRMLLGYKISKKIFNKVTESITEFEFLDDIFTSHEGYLLPYEESLCRLNKTCGFNKDEINNNQEWFASSSHFLWIGDRTKDINNAHVEFFSGISNPVGIKIGPKSSAQSIKSLTEKLNPKNEKGKIVLIFRLGVDSVEKILPDFLNEFCEKEVLWMCDPMHGNTKSLQNGKKVRYLSEIMHEIKIFSDLLKGSSLPFNGIHLESTAENNVLECIDSCFEEGEYKSSCDPRLNYDQTIKIMHFIKSIV